MSVRIHKVLWAAQAALAVRIGALAIFCPYEYNHLNWWYFFLGVIMKVSTVLDGDTRGVWLQDKDGDVHIYSAKSADGIVIGQNKSYTDEIGFSDLAVIFKNNEVTLQYADAGEPKFIVVDPNLAKVLLVGLLQTLKAASVK